MSQVKLVVKCSRCLMEKKTPLIIEAGVNGEGQIEIWCAHHRIPLQVYNLVDPPPIPTKETVKELIKKGIWTQTDTCTCDDPFCPNKLTGRPILEMGQVNVSEGVKKMIEKDKKATLKDFMESIILRHATGDFGDLDEDAKVINFDALLNKGPILSCYNYDKLPGGIIHIFTEASRKTTTIMFPNEH